MGENPAHGCKATIEERMKPGATRRRRSPLNQLRPRKSLGQHFLKDDNIARKIIRALAPDPGDTIVEIGPGVGALTKHLAGTVRRLVAVELDARAVVFLRHLVQDPTVEIVQGDFLKTDLGTLAGPEGQSTQLRVIGNIPYNITTPIVFHLLEHRLFVRDAILMMQREVARRLIALPGNKDYGILSVQCQIFADVQLLFDVAPTAFIPPPNVMSSVVRLAMLPAARVPLGDEAFFRAMVRSVFGKRRKTLRKSLQYFGKERGMVIPELPDLHRRPEELSLEELVHLSDALRMHAGQ
jgi:16S rRNA (adenine1518-N6/adenine1519-N6)-dimethyltransferase